MMTTNILILGDFNAHHSAWYSSSTDTRGTLLDNVVSVSNFGILNRDSPTRLPGNANPSSPDVSLASASLITSTNWQTKTNLGSDHLPILISLKMDHTIKPKPALLQLTSDVATGFNQMKPPHQTVCVAVHLTATFDTVNHNALLSKIARSTLPEATCRWLSNYIRGRQSVTSCRGVKSKARIIHTGVLQGSKFSPTLFSFYIADMPQPTEPVKRICYAVEITVRASGVEISELEHKVNTYLTEMSRFIWENLFLISVSKSSVTLFMPDPAQVNTRPKIKIADSELPLVRSPKLLGVYLDTLFSFNKHCVQVANRVSKRNNVLKALAGTNWGQKRRLY